MVESVDEVTVDAQSDHHLHARKLSVSGATASQLNPQWPERTPIPSFIRKFFKKTSLRSISSQDVVTLSKFGHSH